MARKNARASRGPPKPVRRAIPDSVVSDRHFHLSLHGSERRRPIRHLRRATSWRNDLHSLRRADLGRRVKLGRVIVGRLAWRRLAWRRLLGRWRLVGWGRRVRELVMPITENDRI